MNLWREIDDHLAYAKADAEWRAACDEFWQLAQAGADAEVLSAQSRKVIALADARNVAYQRL